MRTSYVFGLLLAAAVGPCSSVFAAVEYRYHFSPSEPGQTIGVAQFVEVAPLGNLSGPKVQVSGALIGSAPSSIANTAQAYLARDGMGVVNPNPVLDKSATGQIFLDGSRGGEYLRLEFPEQVQLTAMTFAAVSSVDKFGLTADGQPVNLSALFPGLQTIKSITASQLGAGFFPGKVDFTKAAQPLGSAKTWEVFTASGYGDGIQLENVNVIARNGDVIPEPTTVVIWSVLGFGAAGIGGLRRRLRAAR